MNPGRLDRRITIQAPVQARDASGGVVTTWLDAATVSAQRIDQGGREFRSAGSLLSETTAIFEIRYFRGITTAHRVKESETVYDVLAVGEIGRREGMRLQAKVRVHP
jgi:SPP1 family predicted phage head-tail adaptor